MHMFRNKHRKEKINEITMTSRSTTTGATATATATTTDTSQPLLRCLSSSSSRSGGVDGDDGAGDQLSYSLGSRALENVMNEVWIELGHLGNVDYMKELLEVEDFQKTVANAIKACILTMQQYDVPTKKTKKRLRDSSSSSPSSSPRRTNHREQEICRKSGRDRLSFATVSTSDIHTVETRPM